MEKQTTELFDKLRQTLPMPQEKISEFTFYDSIGTQINGALRNLNILEVLSSNWLGDIARLLGGGYLGESLCD